MPDFYVEVKCVDGVAKVIIPAASKYVLLHAEDGALTFTEHEWSLLMEGVNSAIQQRRRVDSVIYEDEEVRVRLTMESRGWASPSRPQPKWRKQPINKDYYVEIEWLNCRGSLWGHQTSFDYVEWEHVVKGWLRYCENTEWVGKRNRMRKLGWSPISAVYYRAPRRKYGSAAVYWPDQDGLPYRVFVRDGRPGLSRQQFNAIWQEIERLLHNHVYLSKGE